MVGIDLIEIYKELTNFERIASQNSADGILFREFGCYERLNNRLKMILKQIILKDIVGHLPNGFLVFVYCLLPVIESIVEVTRPKIK